ncbi:hypothetical protein [uncultured Clostridium sp.]|uniref:hypothetical protein n=1 Tax=uncultured Clostridium sp. TaxID=59620 RepID=UPI00260402E5|nr:hypothetical protein [uncultured Clostridium sp.]
MEINEFDLSTSGNKRIAKTVVNKDSVAKKSLYVIAFILPTAIITGICTGIVEYVGSAILGIILGIISGLLVSVFTLSFFIKIYEAMFEGKAEFGIKFNKEQWFPVALASAITSAIALWTIALSNGALKDLLEIVSLILSVVIIMIYYVAVATKYRGMEAFMLGVKLGFKYFFRILLLILSFIPLALLIVITFGIVGIWKGMYIETTYCILCEKILRREGIEGNSKIKETIEF